MLCAGLWPNTLKMIYRWRFELYFLDFAFGFVIIAAIAAFTLGSFNSRELTFQDNLAIAGYRKMAYCLAAGFTFGLGSFLLAAGIALAGMAVAFIISFGVAAALNVFIALASGSRNGVVLQSLGAAAALAAVIIAAYAHSARADAIEDQLQNVPFRPDPRDPKSKKPNPPPPSSRGIVITILSGIFLGLFSSLLDSGRFGEDGVGPYGAGALFAAGLAAAAVFFTPFFWNFPAMGRALHLRDYFKGDLRNHLLGWCGGLMAGLALVTSIVGQAASGAAQLSSGLTYAFSRGDVIVAALCGLLAWNEFGQAEGKTSMIFATSVVAIAISVALVAFSQS